MVVRVRVQMDVEALARTLNASRNNIRFAAAASLTHVAKAGQKQLTIQIGQRFDNPTPWIRKGTFVKPATPDTLTSEVGIKDQGASAPPAKYMNEHLNAGARSSKPMELALRAAGVLPDGWLVVPSRFGVKLDAYGNVSKATFRKILQAVTSGSTASTGAGTFRMFVVKPGSPLAARLQPGIWSAARIGGQSQAQPVLLFVQQATYQQVIDLEQLAGAVVAQEFSAKFRAMLDQARGRR